MSELSSRRRSRGPVVALVGGALLALALAVPPAATATPTIPPPMPTAPYTFLSTQPSDHKLPVRWDPCVVHRYKVVTAGMSKRVLASLFKAVSRVSAASGITLRYAGTTHVVPNSGNDMFLPSAAGADIVLAFTAPGVGRGRTDILSAHDAALARGGAAWRGGGIAWYSSGYAVFDVRKLPTTGDRRLALFEHELGHVLGLDHVKLSTDVMYPMLSYHPLTWSPGFYDGLVAIGRLAGCRKG